MALPLKDAFTARAIGIAWDNYKASLGEEPYLGRSKFGTTKQQGLDLEFIKGQNSLPVTLKASNFDAQAPLRDGIGFSTIQNQMPFYREGYMVTEKEEQDYASYVASNSVGYANQVLANIMKKPLDLVKGARVVPERMIWQLLCPTHASGVPTITVNIDGDTTKAYDIEYIATNKQATYKSDHFTELKGTSQWTDSANATPLDDLIKMKRDFAKATGYNLSRFTMNTTTFEAMLNCEDTKKQVLGITAYQGGIRLRQADVLSYLAENGITIEIYDKVYVDENGESQNFVPDYMVSATSSGVYLGTVTYGTTPEERSGSLTDGSLSIVETGIALYSYSTNHPINTHVVCSSIVLPTFEGIDSICYMNVKAGDL